MIVNARPSDLRCQKHRLTTITHAVDGPSNRVLCRSIPYFLGPGRLSRLKIFFLYPARAELIRLGKDFAYLILPVSFGSVKGGLSTTDDPPSSHVAR